MKRQAVLLMVWGLLGLVGAGCGGTEQEPLPSPDAPSAGEQQPGAPSETTAPDDGAQSGTPDDREVHEMARNCQTTCSAVKFDTGATCSAISGFGSTTFLGGCTKACRFAREDAQRKATAVNCSIVTCSDDCT